MSGGTVPYIGSKISLISNSQIRYEGILYTINAQESTIALQSVHCFGTEGRRTPEVPPSNEVYDFIIFRGQDIQDLTVLESMANATDPAIVSVNQRPATHGKPAGKSAGKGVEVPPPAQSKGASQGLGPWSKGAAPAHTPSKGLEKGYEKGGDKGSSGFGSGGYAGKGASAASSWAGGSAWNAGGKDSGYGSHDTYGKPSDSYGKGYGNTSGYGNSGYGAGTSYGGNHSTSGSYGSYGASKGGYGSGYGTGGGNYGSGGSYSGYKGDSGKSSQAGFGKTGAKGGGKDFGKGMKGKDSKGGKDGRKGGRDEGGRIGLDAMTVGELRPQVNAAVKKEVEKDFDVDAANSKFDKVAVPDDGSMEDALKPLSGYDKKKSFFDNISCEATERAGESERQRIDRDKAKEFDKETFGDMRRPPRPTGGKGRRRPTDGYRP